MANQAKSFCSALNIVENDGPKDKLYSRLEIELKGIEPEVMKSYAWYATTGIVNLLERKVFQLIIYL